MRARACWHVCVRACICDNVVCLKFDHAWRHPPPPGMVGRIVGKVSDGGDTARDDEKDGGDRAGDDEEDDGDKEEDDEEDGGNKGGDDEEDDGDEEEDDGDK